MAYPLIALTLAVTALANDPTPSPFPQNPGSALSVSLVSGSSLSPSQAITQPGGSAPPPKRLEPKDRQRVALALRSAAGLVRLPPAQKKLTDANADGRVNAQDARAILRRSLGVEEDVPLQLKESIKSSDPSVLSRRLTEALGVPVRFTLKSMPAVSIEAGDWTARRLLDEVARQIQGRWAREFAFKAVKSTALSKQASVGKENTVLNGSKLPSAGTVSLQIKQIPFAQAVHSITHAAACRAVVPGGIPGLYDLNSPGMPVEGALSELSTQAGLAVSMGILFEKVDEKTILQQAVQKGQAGDTSETDEHLKEMEEGSRHVIENLALLDKFQKLTKQDPFDPGFTWDRVTPEQWKQMGLTPEEAADFRAALDELALNRRKAEALSAAQLTGDTEGAAAIDPSFNPNAGMPEDSPSQP